MTSQVPDHPGALLPSSRVGFPALVCAWSYLVAGCLLGPHEPQGPQFPPPFQGHDQVVGQAFSEEVTPGVTCGGPR